MFIARFADGRIAETWGVVDMLSQLRQLGAIPAQRSRSHAVRCAARPNKTQTAIGPSEAHHRRKKSRRMTDTNDDARPPLRIRLLHALGKEPDWSAMTPDALTAFADAENRDDHLLSRG